MPELEQDELDNALQEALSRIKIANPEIEFELQQAQAKLKEAVHYLAGHGWTIPWHLDIRQLRLLADWNRDQIDNFFEEYYRNEALLTLREEILGDKKLEKWKLLLDQCFRNYEQGDFQICIPSLIAVIEGSFNNEDFRKEKGRTKFFDTNIRAVTGSTKVAWTSLRLFCELVFKSGDFNSLTDYINRHKIMHGVDDPAGWTKTDCLRLFQAVDSIRRLLR